MKGHVAKKRNKYYIVVDIKDDITGKRKRKWISGADGGFERKKDAERAMPAILDKLIKGTYIEPSKQTVGEIMLNWLKDKKTSVKYNTWKSYEWLVTNHIIPNIGQIPILKLKPKHLHDLYHTTLLEKLSVGSIRKAHVIIVDALNREVLWGHIPHNIATVVTLPQGKKKKFEVWNEDQLKLFLDIARDDQYYIAFELAASTGMRQSEILALRRVDVDTKKTKTISVRQAYTLAEVGHDFDDTKSESSERSVSLFEDTVILLNEHLFKQEQKRKNSKIYNDSGLVVQTGVGTPLGPRNLMRHYYRILDKIVKKHPDFPKIRFQDLRHTHATLLLKGGIHPKIVQERLGHSSITVTIDTYSHVLPNLQDTVLKNYGSSILGDQNTPENNPLVD